MTIEEGARVAAALEQEGVCFIEVSHGMPGRSFRKMSHGKEKAPIREAYLLPDARVIRGSTSVPLAVVGGMRSLSVMEEADRVRRGGLRLALPPPDPRARSHQEVEERRHPARRLPQLWSLHEDGQGREGRYPMSTDPCLPRRGEVLEYQSLRAFPSVFRRSCMARRASPARRRFSAWLGSIRA